MSKPVLVLATGPTLNDFRVDLFRDKVFVIAVNDAYTLCPWADMFYACDFDWWTVHGQKVAKLKGDKVTLRHDELTPTNVLAREVQAFPKNQRRGVSMSPDRIFMGHNSGFQALQLAVQKSRKVYLAGFDMGATGPTHFFGDHPSTLTNGSNYDDFVADFAETRNELAAVADIALVTSPSGLSHLFRTITTEDALRELS